MLIRNFTGLRRWFLNPPRLSFLPTLWQKIFNRRFEPNCKEDHDDHLSGATVCHANRRERTGGNQCQSKRYDQNNKFRQRHISYNQMLLELRLPRRSPTPTVLHHSAQRLPDSSRATLGFQLHQIIHFARSAASAASISVH